MPNSESIGSLVEAWLPEYELAPERLLKLFQLLPSDAGLRQVEELVFVLEEFSFAAPEMTNGDFEFMSAERLEDLFREFLTSSVHTFAVPLGHGRLEDQLFIGGRYELAISRGLEDDWVRLSGSVNTGHHFSARRIATALAGEVSGCLWATGLLEYNAFGRTEWMEFGDPRLVVKPAQIFIKALQFPDYETVGELVPMSLRETEQLRNFHFGKLYELNELERASVSRNESAVVIRDRLALVSRLFSSGGKPLRRMRTAARFARRAVTSLDPSDSFLNCAIAMESLMVDGRDGVSARVRDAVALRLGESMTEREEIRSLVKRIYEVRSKFLHDGDGDGTEAERLRAISLLRRLLAAELRLGE
jgi:hypothetical protein